MELKDFEKMELCIGKGENHFTMSRGSFKYKQKISLKNKLLLSGREDIPGGFRLIYLDVKTRDEFTIAVTKDSSGAICVKYELSENPLDSKNDINRWWISFPGLTNGKELVKILGNGELKAKIDVEANAFSKTAEEAIKTVGGNATKI